jgi:8-amino-7-oxononanoate synthase
VGDAAVAMKVAAQLQERGLDVRAVRPPTVPQGTSRLRLTVTADHTPQDVEGALARIAEVRREL